MSRVDVIVPCYNYARYLRGCLDSILQQEGVDVRVLLLDDASTDETATIGAAIAAAEPRVEYRRHATNIGHIATYNEGLAWATGDYLLLISADDGLTPGALRRAARVLETRRDVVLTYGSQIIFHTDAFPAAPPVTSGGYRVLAGHDFLAHLCRSGENCVPTPTVVVRVSAQRAVGGYRPELPHTGDLEMWLRFATRGDVAILDADQAYKRRHGLNMQIGYLDGAVGDLRQRQMAFEMLFREYRSCVPDSARLEHDAKQAIAMDAFWQASRAFDAGDGSRCAVLVDLAAWIDPTVRVRPEWARLQWKRRLGPHAWRVVRPVLDCIRPASGG